MKNKKSILFVIFLLIGVALFIGTIGKYGVDNILDTLKQFSLMKFLFLVAISIFNFYLFSFRWETIVKTIYKEKKIPSLVFFLDRLAAYAISYITPTAQVGGEPMRIIMLHDEGVPKEQAASSVIIDKALEIATLITFISAGVVIASFEPSLNPQTKYFMIGAMIFLIIVMFWFFYSSIKQIGFFTSIIKILHLKKFKKLEHLETKMSEFENKMNDFYRSHPKTVIKLLLLNLLMIGFMLLEHFIVAYFLGVRLSLLQTFLVSTIPYVAYLLPVPGGLGILESGHAMIFALMGVNINAFVFVLILRMRDFVFVTLGLIRGSQKGVRLIKKEFGNDYNEP